MKGYVKMLEATLASVFLLGMLLILYPYQPETPDVDYGSIGYDCLKYLDQQNKLSRFAENNDEAELESELQKCIPGALNFQVKICKTAECSIDISKTETHVSTYFVSGFEKPEPAMVKIWVSVK